VSNAPRLRKRPAPLSSIAGHHAILKGADHVMAPFKAKLRDGPVTEVAT
jgi:hypothetical protein